MKRKSERLLHAGALAILLAGAAALTGCEGITGDTPRAAWERAMSAYAERNYGELWDNLSEQSKQDTIRVLTHVKREPKYLEVMRVKLKIPPQLLVNMAPREFFIALMTGVERSAPQMIALRAETAQTAEFSRQEVAGDRATVYWSSDRGGPEKMAFVLESERWKPIIER